MNLAGLKRKSQEVWRKTLLLHKSNPGVRVASSLSPVELLTVLYYKPFLRFSPQEPLWQGRDRLIASKGHGAAALYPILADLGFFESAKLERIGWECSEIGMIPDPCLPGIETVNGSLGHGLGVGLGMALSLAAEKNPARAVVLHGDGELSEGSVWEAAMLAGYLKLDHLTLLVDVNGRSMLGNCRGNAEQYEQIFSGFGWKVIRCDGHNVEGLICACEKLFSVTGKPAVLLSETIKGHGVPELEQAPLAHVMNLKPERIDELVRKGAL